jgi:hypothetical protein
MSHDHGEDNGIRTVLSIPHRERERENSDHSEPTTALIDDPYERHAYEMVYERCTPMGDTPMG